MNSFRYKRIHQVPWLPLSAMQSPCIIRKLRSMLIPLKLSMIGSTSLKTTTFYTISNIALNSWIVPSQKRAETRYLLSETVCRCKISSECTKTRPNSCVSPQQDSCNLPRDLRRSCLSCNCFTDPCLRIEKRVWFFKPCLEKEVVVQIHQLLVSRKGRDILVLR